MGDTFGYVNAIGLSIVIFGVILFNVHKLQRLKKVCRSQDNVRGITLPSFDLPAFSSSFPAALIRVMSLASRQPNPAKSMKATLARQSFNRC